MSRENSTNSDYIYPYPLSKLNTCFFPQDQKFYFQNQNKNINNNNFLDASRPQTYFPSPVTNDDTTSSCCSMTASDQQCIGAEDHAGDDFASDPEVRSPDSPTTPTTPFGVNVNISSYPWPLSTVYEISPPPPSIPQKFFSFNSNTQSNYPLLSNLNTQQNVIHQQKNESSPDIISPPQTSPSLSTSSCLDYIEGNHVENNFTKEDDDNTNNDNDHDVTYHDDHHGEVAKKICHRKSKEDIFLKFKLPVNGIATRTRSKKPVPNSDPPSSSKKKQQQQQQQQQQRQHRHHHHHHHHHLTEEEKVIQKYSSKVADIPPFSRKVTIPSMNPQITNVTSSPQKNPNYPIPKTKQQILSNWTYRDQKRFLATYLSEGKNFGHLAKSLNKSTKEVVEFYYYFKMSPKFRSAKVIKKDLMSYGSKLEQINESITKLKHLSSAGKTSPSPPMRVTFAPSVISSRKRRGRPKKASQVRGGIYYY